MKVKNMQLYVALLAIFASLSCWAQVTIGSDQHPKSGTLLDLNQHIVDPLNPNRNSNKGLGLPRVKLEALNSLQPCVSPYVAGTSSIEHIGLTVYNISNVAPFKEAVYIWDGNKWGIIESGGGSGGGGASPWFISGTTNTATSNTDNIYQTGKVSVGTSLISPSAMLNVVSTDKGILIPRMTSANRDAIVSPETGLLIFNTESNCIEQYRNTTELWYNLCTRTISGIGSANINCAGITVNGPVLRVGEKVPTGYTVTIPYRNGNGGSYPQTVINNAQGLGLLAILPKGAFASGDGVLTYFITGTPSAGGLAIFTVNLGGSTCSFQIEVKDTKFATNCSGQFGLNIPHFPLSSSINIGGAYVYVSIKTSSVPGSIGVNPEGGFCGSSLRNDGSPVRLGDLSSAAVSRITLIFSQPVNNVSIISNWYYRGDLHSITTNSSGTLTPVNILSDCLSDFNITGSGTKRITVTCTIGANNRGLTYIVNATQPYSEITILADAADGGAGYDDIIAAFGLCDAYVSYNR